MKRTGPKTKIQPKKSPPLRALDIPGEQDFTLLYDEAVSERELLRQKMSLWDESIVHNSNVIAKVAGGGSSLVKSQEGGTALDIIKLTPGEVLFLKREIMQWNDDKLNIAQRFRALNPQIEEYKRRRDSQDHRMQKEAEEANKHLPDLLGIAKRMRTNGDVPEIHRAKLGEILNTHNEYRAKDQATGRNKTVLYITLKRECEFAQKAQQGIS